jgi:uncharacterized protein YndB with AHSA1/START domain
MATIRISAERIIDAPADTVYALLADYRHGHPLILPPSFSNFMVLEGGVGAGTRIHFTLTLAGRASQTAGRVTEPEPGRVLTEHYDETGSLTTFTADPLGDAKCRLRIDSNLGASSGLRGLVERLVVPRLLPKIYQQELSLVQQIAPTWSPID